MRRKKEGESRSSKFFLLLAAIAALGLAYFFTRPEESPIREVLKKVAPQIERAIPVADPVESEPESAGLEFSETTGGGGPSSGSGGLGPEVERYFCRLSPEGIYLVPEVFMEPFLVGGISKLIVTDEESRCLKTGLAVSLAFVSLDRSTRIPFKQRIIAKAEVKRVRDFGAIRDLQVDGYDPNIFGFKSLHEHSRAITEAYGPESLTAPVREIEFSLTNRSTSKEGYGAPKIHPLARTLKKDDLSSLNPFYIDLRRESLFKEGTIPEAINFPLASPVLKGDIKEYQTVKRLGVVNEESLKKLLPVDRLIVPFAEDERVGTAYHFINYLHQIGARNIGYLRGGFAEFGGHSASTPESVHGIATVDFADVQRLASSGAAIIDTRNMGKFIRGSLPGAHVASYKESFTSPIRSAEMKGEALLRSGDQFQMPSFPKSKALVFYANNDTDWTSLKAATIAREAGYKVSWYRKGFDDWLFQKEFFPKTPIQNNLTKENWEKALKDIGLNVNRGGIDPSVRGNAPGVPREKGAIRPPAKDDTYLYQIPINEPQRPVKSSD